MNANQCDIADAPKDIIALIEAANELQPKPAAPYGIVLHRGIDVALLHSPLPPLDKPD